MKLFIFSILLFASYPSWSAAPTLEHLSALPVLAGSPLKLDPNAKGYVVVFLSAKCPCSNSHVPELKELSEKFKEFQFVGIHSNMDESLDKSVAYFKETGLPFALLQDPDASVANELKAYKTPHVFVISANGETLYQGGVTNSATAPKATEHYLKAALQDLQEGHKVKIANGRTLGCVIQREKTQNVW